MQQLATTRQRPGAPRALPSFALYLLFFAAVALAHSTLLHLPYFWDEAGYYIPAALDFYRTGTLIPVFTNAHPPLPNVVIGSLWHLFGVHIVVARLAACAFAAGGLLAVFLMGSIFLGQLPAIALVLLTAIYPIWFAQSSLVHADIFAACFSLAGIAVYLTAPERLGEERLSSRRRLGCIALFFSLSVLSKETAIVQPAALAVLELGSLFRARKLPGSSRRHLRWLAALGVALPVLVAWYGYHYLKTGYIFGNPVYLRYNATANFTFGHIARALQIRSIHLFWQRNIWVPIVLAAACLLLLTRPRRLASTLPPRVLLAIAVLVVANLVAFSVLGGALLTRYLLPIYPLLLVVCLSVWLVEPGLWPWLAALSGLAFLVALWWNPWTFFAPEDNLTYRDMIVVQQEAIAFLQAHYPQATVLTAWPASSELERPDLGYTAHGYKVYSLENFTSPELEKAARQPGQYDTALVFTTHYLSPAFRRYLLAHPYSWRGRRYVQQLDKTPAEIARLLHGRVVWQDDHNGEWAAILRFDRSYDAFLAPCPAPPDGRSASVSYPISLPYNQACKPKR